MTTHDYADVNGVRLHYASSGTGELLLFLHGFPEFWYAWREQLDTFGRDGHYRAVAPDMRGYNLSSKPPEVAAYRSSALVEDVRALVARLGHARFTLVGHDWGGVVAWAFALAHPDLLDRLVIVNAPHPAIFARELQRNPAQQAASQYMLIFRGPDAERLLAANNDAMLFDLMRGWGVHGDFLNAEDRTAYATAWSQPGALTGGLNYYRASPLKPPASSEDARSDWAALDPAALVVHVPTLVIWGERDRALLTGNLDGLDQFVPDLTVKRIPDGSHWVVHEQPVLVDGYIKEFIASR